MKPNLPTRRMREHPDLDQLKRQAKDLLRGFAAGDPPAVAEVNAHYRDASPSTFALHDAQLVVARSYGFDSWPKLKAFVDGVTVRRLAEAVSAADSATVRDMLRARPELADMALSYGDERRPLHFAVMARSPEMVRLLMQHNANAREGVDPHRDATEAWTMAWERGFSEIVAIMEEEEQRRAPAPPAPEAPDPKPVGDEELRALAAAGDLEALRARHAQGTLVNPVRWGDGGLLTIAVKQNLPGLLALLLDFGFDPNERVSIGEGDWVAWSQGFPLWTAAALDRRDIAELLLRRGADPNVHVDSSGSSVYSAYSHKHWEMADLLRRHGGIVTPDIAAIYRQTGLAREMLAARPQEVAQELLHFAAMGGDPEIVRLALQHIDWPRDDPRWFRQLVEPLSFWQHIPWLYAGNREFDRATYLSCFRLILERCDANLIGGFRRTALHEVSAMGDHVTEEEAAAFATALLDAGAVMDVRDDLLSSTPLGWACRWGRAAVAAILLERGADPVEAGAPPWARPRAWAERLGHAAVLAVLRKHGA